jgi:hypothetical protein
MLPEVWPALLASAAMALAVLGLDRLVDAESRPIAAGLALVGGEMAFAACVYLAVLALIAPPMAREAVTMAGGLRRRLARRRPAGAAGDPAETHVGPAAPSPIAPEGDQST